MTLEPEQQAVLAQTIAFDVTDQDKCAGAKFLCTHDKAHPCRRCHILAFGLLAAVSINRAETHGGPNPFAVPGSEVTE